ncbi:uncharacterized protein MELLADRAFT_69911 [Melampsora larici-populina 98AG31]|uniref:Uncharacterized protein n=1 Tax=Melampsora larici-populina (strain 98AG31 / pathotype 3-4-7) TaxID=747676 RepID=F4SCR8_MELLP|nr:uncharacterized protein MELLADRAFT_69911 [Melampsora larici-populina 98AG31]EGF97561.1 hypothetical protein MELLADRAFT_69911 [Melampsora larici-populina 98AG31]
MEVDDAPDPGKKDQSVPKNTSPTRDASNAFINPVEPQDRPKPTEPPTPFAFDKATLRQGLTHSPSIQSSDLGSFAKKRSRLDTPGVIATDQASELTGSPRTNRMQNLFPGGADSPSLKEMVGKLLEVVKAGFPLANKSKKAQKVSVDVETAADILILTGSVYDQIMYEDARRNFTTPAALSGSQQKTRSIIFKASTQRTTGPVICAGCIQTCPSKQLQCEPKT